MISPINPPVQKRVLHLTNQYISLAEEIFQRTFSPVPVCFDLKGGTVGMYRVKKDGPQIRYNPYLFSKYLEDNLENTVPHEVAHYITDTVFGLRNIRPHGREWKTLMRKFGCDARPTCQYSLEGIPVRKEARHQYRCACTTHLLSRRRHNRIVTGVMRYSCKNCGQKLLPQPAPKSQ